MFLTTSKTRKLCEARNAWHSGWWGLKFFILLISMVVPLFVPSYSLQLYGTLIWQSITKHSIFNNGPFVFLHTGPLCINWERSMTYLVHLMLEHVRIISFNALFFSIIFTSRYNGQLRKTMENRNTKSRPKNIIYYIWGFCYDGY